MTAYVSNQHRDLIEGFNALMSKTPTTIEDVMERLGYMLGSTLTLEMNGEARTVQLEGTNVPIAVKGDCRLTLHVRYGKHRFMIFVHMIDVRRGAKRVRVSMMRHNYKLLFGTQSERPSTVDTSEFIVV